MEFSINKKTVKVSSPENSEASKLAAALEIELKGKIAPTVIGQ